MTALATARASRLLPAEPVLSHRRHVDAHGALPDCGLDRELLLAELEESNLTGRGGGGFPTARKLRAVAVGRKSIVVANGTEGEPASAKDKLLLARNPHLVIDGVVAAAQLIGAREAVIAVGRESRDALHALRTALAGRDEPVSVDVAEVPDRFVAGEESALVAWLNGGEAKPTLTPPRPSQAGVRGRPTLVQNVETLANLALVVRHGARDFLENETVLATVRGAVSSPGVVEVEAGAPLGAVVDSCGGVSRQPRALLVGGYFGTWIPAAGTAAVPLTREGLAPLGAAPGARTIVVLPSTACGVFATAQIVRYLAGESAGQCGPCVFGLPAVADCLEAIADCRADAAAALDRLPRLDAQIARRGACRHPDGVLRLVASALRVFDDEIALHIRGHCTCSDRMPLLFATSTDWR
jgi:NADH:ubiquinone oxidoreductase subunit F (NADH-binding)